LFHVNVAWLVALATEEETPMAADAQNFWHVTGFYGAVLMATRLSTVSLLR
jgi:hypothetical protein